MPIPIRQSMLPALPLLALAFLLYVLPPMLPAGFHAIANFLLQSVSVLPSTYTDLVRSTIEHSCALLFFGVLVAFAPKSEPKPGNFLIRLAVSLGILVVCGFIAASLGWILARIGFGATPTAVLAQQENSALGELRSTWGGTMLLIINTTTAGFKEELVYRVVPGLILAYLFGHLPGSAQNPGKNTGSSIRMQNPINARPRQLELFFLVLVFSLLFALAHQGIGTILASAVLGTAFLYLILRGWPWQLLALAHTVYNLAVLLLR